MDPLKARSGKGPEAPVKEAIKKYLQSLRWYVVVTHGNQFQSGLPDLYACHQNHGVRWIEVKYAEKYEFTDRQKEVFPEFAARGVGIWVLSMKNHKDTVELEQEYKKLFFPANWYVYLGHTRRPF